MKGFRSALVALVIAGCMSTPVVQTDFDASTDFSSYGSYAWRQEPAVRNPLMKQRLVAAIDEALAARGWRRVPESQADVALVAHVATHEEQTLETFYDDADWNGWSWRHGGMSVRRPYATRVYRYTVGTLVLDMFDTRSRRAIWRATAEGAVPSTPAETSAAIESAVDRMFERFPAVASR